MTNPRHAPRFGTWSVPHCRLVVEYDLQVLEVIRTEVTSGFEAASGALELGGLLLGHYDGDRVRITAFERVACEHAYGPAFVLSQDDAEALAGKLLAYQHPPGSSEPIVVGWYQSHLRRGLALSAEDVKIYDRYFPQPWQVALLLRPAPAGSIHARFFLREGAAPARRIEAGEAPTLNGPGVAVERHIPAAAPAARIELPEPTEAKPDRLEMVKSSAEVVRTAKSRGAENRAVWAVLAAMFFLAVASVFYLRFHFAMVPHPAGVLPLEASLQNGGVEVRWDTTAIAGAQRGMLEVRDGAAVQRYPLDRDTLVYGKFTCWPKSDVTAFLLHVDRTAGGTLEGSTTYVARSAPASAIAQAPPPVVAEQVPIPSPPAASIPAADQKPAQPALSTAQPLSVNPAPVEVAAKSHVEDRKPVAPSTQPTANSAPPPAITHVPETVKREESAKPALEQKPPPAEPVQTAQIQHPPLPERPATLDIPPPIQLQPVPSPLTRALPQTSSAPPPAAPRPQFHLGGRWMLQSGGYSRSPAVPESLSIAITDGDSGVQGTLEARYKSRSKTERVNFSFSGKMVNGIARFPWTSADGRHGQIEFIRVPNSPDTVEVVWQNPEQKQVFDEMLRRAGQ